MHFRTDIRVLSGPVLLFLAFAAEVDCAAALPVRHVVHSHAKIVNTPAFLFGGMTLIYWGGWTSG